MKSNLLLAVTLLLLTGRLYAQKISLKTGESHEDKKHYGWNKIAAEDENYIYYSHNRGIFKPDFYVEKVDKKNGRTLWSKQAPVKGYFTLILQGTNFVLIDADRDYDKKTVNMTASILNDQFKVVVKQQILQTYKYVDVLENVKFSTDEDNNIEATGVCQKVGEKSIHYHLDVYNPQTLKLISQTAIPLPNLKKNDIVHHLIQINKTHAICFVRSKTEGKTNFSVTVCDLSNQSASSVALNLQSEIKSLSYVSVQLSDDKKRLNINATYSTQSGESATQEGLMYCSFDIDKQTFGDIALTAFSKEILDAYAPKPQKKSQPIKGLPDSYILRDSYRSNNTLTWVMEETGDVTGGVSTFNGTTTSGGSVGKYYGNILIVQTDLTGTINWFKVVVKLQQMTQAISQEKASLEVLHKGDQTYILFPATLSSANAPEKNEGYQFSPASTDNALVCLVCDKQGNIQNHYVTIKDNPEMFFDLHNITKLSDISYYIRGEYHNASMGRVVKDIDCILTID